MGELADKNGANEAQLRDKVEKANEAVQVLASIFDFTKATGVVGTGPALKEGEEGEWHVDCTAEIGDEQQKDDAIGEVQGRDKNRTVRVLPRDKCSSIRTAVEGLNAGVFQAPEGYAIVYSASRGSYYLVYRTDAKDEALEEFNLKEEDSD